MSNAFDVVDLTRFGAMKRRETKKRCVFCNSDTPKGLTFLRINKRFFCCKDHCIAWNRKWTTI